MKHPFLVGLVLSVSAPPIAAHGGAYRGPPPRALAGPTTPGPGPMTPGGLVGPLTPSGPVAPDLSRWSVWWEFNKDPYLRLRDSLWEFGTITGSDEFYLGAGHRQGRRESALAPAAGDRRGLVFPALRRQLDSSTNKDIVTACMIAIAKIAADVPPGDLRGVFEPGLTRGDQEIRETAALAMGLTRQAWALAPLIALLTDAPQGRALTGTGEVDDRTRAFAAYGLGLIASQGDADVKRQVYDVLASTVSSERTANRDLQVGVLQAIGLLDVAGRDDGKHKRILWESVRLLHEFAGKDLGRGHDIVQAHALTAMARLLGRGSGPDHERTKELLATLLRGKRGDALQQAAVLALGLIVEPRERRSDDARYSDLLRDAFKTAADQQTRYYSLVALAQIGGDDNREVLIDLLRRGKNMDAPWAALALGLLGHGERSAPATDRVGDALLDRLTRANGPEERGALAVALGLCQYKAAADELRAMLDKYDQDDWLVGYVCVGLAMMQDDRAVEDIRRIVERSVRRPELLRQAAVALGKLGDRNAAELLVQLLTDTDPGVARLSAIASALGQIGDRRSLPPLLVLLESQSLTKLSRAFVVAALGAICDPDVLPWNARIAVGTNYRASVDTLTDGLSGILDIL